MLLPKAGRVILSPEAYRQLQQQVFERDGWRCRRCGRRAHLQLHHLRRRSDVRIDTLENSLTLCSECHGLEKRKLLEVIGDNGNELVLFRVLTRT